MGAGQGEQHQQVQLALLSAGDGLAQLPRGHQVGPHRPQLVAALFIVVPPPPRLRPVYLLPWPATPRKQVTLLGVMQGGALLSSVSVAADRCAAGLCARLIQSLQQRIAQIETV